MAGTSMAHSVIGKPRQRVDGPLKVTGSAKYTSDFHFPGMLYAVPVGATIANGEIRSLNTAAAEKMPGVRAIYHRKNLGKLFRIAPGDHFGADMAHVDEVRPPLEDDVIRYYGQYVALAVADTLEQAKAAADAVEVTYRKENPNVDADLSPKKKPAAGQESGKPAKVESERGDAERGFDDGPGSDRRHLQAASRNAQPDRIALHRCDLGRHALYDLRSDAGRRQPSQRPGPNARRAEGKRARNLQIHGLGLRRQTVSLDAFRIDRGGGPKSWQAGETGRQPADDVSMRRPSARYLAANAHRRDAGGEARLRCVKIT